METNEQLDSLIKILDKELDAYTKLKDLFEEKREILKKSKTDDLGVLDNKILAQHQIITKLNKTREEISQKILGKNGNMSDFIEFAQEHAPDYVSFLEDRKVKICNNFDRLALLNQQNVELLKHGIVITNKMLETIIDAFAPQGSYYDDKGKAADTHDMDMWTISEEI